MYLLETCRNPVKGFLWAKCWSVALIVQEFFLSVHVGSSWRFGCVACQMWAGRAESVNVLPSGRISSVWRASWDKLVTPLSHRQTLYRSAGHLHHGKISTYCRIGKELNNNRMFVYRELLLLFPDLLVSLETLRCVWCDWCIYRWSS